VVICLVLAHLGSPGKRAVERVCVCVLLYRSYMHSTTARTIDYSRYLYAAGSNASQTQKATAALEVTQRHVRTHRRLTDNIAS